MALGTFSVTDQLRTRLEDTFPGDAVEVGGGGGHFTIKVVSAQFEGLNTLKKQRLVYSAIKDLMAGDSAPVHAIDSMQTICPDET